MAEVAGFLLDYVWPNVIWIVSGTASVWWAWHAWRHNLRPYDLPRWWRGQTEDELVVRAAARARYEKETGRNWRVAGFDPGMDPYYRGLRPRRSRPRRRSARRGRRSAGRRGAIRTTESRNDLGPH
jgi:hypothetical protein